LSTEHGFGRLVQVDDRDKNYLLKTILPKVTERTQRYWDSKVFLDQDGTPMCVGYGWAHWVDDPPVSHPQLIDPVWIYNEAQKIDGFPMPHDGSTVRAAAKVLQGRKVISNYYWAQSVDDIVMAVLEAGPVTVGTNWYSGMSSPDLITGVMKPTGNVVGGHCYMINGVDTKTGLFRIKNSWGRLWGKQGEAYLSIDDLGKLLAANGEGCLATEVPGDIPVPAPKSWWDNFVDWLKSLFGIK
jgi:hypothetical protein